MSHSDDQEKRYEENRLRRVLKEIGRKMEKIEEKTGNLKKDIVHLRKTFWEDVTVNIDDPDDVIETHTSIKQQAEFLSERERSHGQFYKQYKKLERLKFSPYFGRIDFVEDGEGKSEKIYIGLFSLTDENDEKFLVYDWRAPISGMYYDFAPGPAWYETMDGRIHGEIRLKRQYIIRHGELKGMFDTGITIGDEILQTVLSGRADTQMKSIVATIQREQNAIIRNDRKKYLVVQGAAGSGKTSAALQRVAYLLYKYREKLSADNILLFSPNPLFNSYVSTVLPELGEDNMEQTTFYQYLRDRLKEFDVEDPYGQMEYILSKPKTEEYEVRKDAILFKAGLKFKQLIDEYVQSLDSSGMLFKHISFRKEIFITKQELTDYFYSLGSNITIPNRIQKVKEWILEKIAVKEKEEKTKEWVQEEGELLEREDYVRVYKKLQRKKRFSEKTFDDFQREEQLIADLVVKRKMAPLRKKIENLAFVDLRGLYGRLFQWIKENTSAALPETWEDIAGQTVRMLKKGKLYYEDATPFLYLKDKLEGKVTYRKIRHVFIDEAQDYSPFQFAYLKEIFPFSRMTILGDVNQSIFLHSAGKKNGIDYAEKLFGKEDLEKMVLTKSYRSTKQIIEFSKGILTGEHPIIPFNRNGKRPVIHTVKTKNSLHGGILETIRGLQQSGHETIAVITKTDREAKNAYEVLKDQIPVHYIRKETLAYKKGISIIPVYLAKGIEFDAVIIYDASEEVYREENERKLFYTACTRAMHELHLFSRGELSPFLKAIEPDRYEIIAD